MGLGDAIYVRTLVSLAYCIFFLSRLFRPISSTLADKEEEGEFAFSITVLRTYVRTYIILKFGLTFRIGLSFRGGVSNEWKKDCNNFFFSFLFFPGGIILGTSAKGGRLSHWQEMVKAPSSVHTKTHFLSANYLD